MSDATARLRRNTKLLYAVSFLESSYYIDAIYVVFGVEYLKLNFLQAGSFVFVAWWVSIIFDFWGGVLADTIGRKRTQVIGLALQAAAFLPFLFLKSYSILLPIVVVGGIGRALASNTLQAVVYEQAAEQNDAALYQRLNAFSQVWIFAGVASATLIGGLAYTLDPRLPYGLTSAAFAAACLASYKVEVPKRVEAELSQKNERGRIIKTALQTFRQHRQLRYFVIVSFFAGICGDMLFAYYQPYFIKLHVTALTLGIMFASLRVVSGCGSYLMHKLPDTLSLPAIQTIGIVCTGISAALLLVLKLPVVLVIPVVTAIGYGFNEPAMRLFVNRHAENSARAATLSFGTMAMNFGVGIGFIISFWMADKFSSQVILQVLLVITAATLLLSLASLRPNSPETTA